MRHFPAFSAHLPKVRRWGTAPRTPVAAFPFPPGLPHLPKVRHFPAFSTHLPKVRRWGTAPRTPVAAFPFPPACSRVSISTRPSTPSEGEALSRIFRSPSEGAQMHHRPENACSRISLSTRPSTPSEGEALSRIFRSPSEGAQMRHRRQTTIQPRFHLHQTFHTFRR